MVTGPDTVVEARRTLGRQLAAYRRAAGLSQHQLADSMHYGRSTIANVETGRQNVGREFWQQCDGVLQASGVLVEGYERMVTVEAGFRRRQAAALNLKLPARPPHFVAVPADADAAGDALVRRREALLAGIAAVAAASGFIGAHDRGLRQRIGAGDVARLQAIIALYRSMDYECGGGAVVAEVGRFADTAASRMAVAQCADALRPRALATLAEARQLAGWTAFDSGLNLEAQRHWLAAERAAVAAGDMRLAARVRYCQARQFQHLHHNEDALATLHLAQEQLARTATPAITAMLLGAQAASLAALGQYPAAQDRLDAASTAFEHIDAAQEPDWMGFFDHGEVLAQYGRVYRDMARDDPRHGPAAVRWTSEAIAAFGPQHVRSGLLNEIGLCSALFLAGEPNQALTVGVRILADAPRVASHRILDRVANLRRDLVHHMSLADVRQFSHALTLEAGVS